MAYDAATGTQRWDVGGLDGNSVPSPTIHGSKLLVGARWGTPIVSQDRIYFFGKDGKTLVLKAGTECEVLATNELWDPANPPKPETYVEGTRLERRGTTDGGAAVEGSSASSGRPSGNRSGAGGPGGPGGPGGGMMAMLAAADKNGGWSTERRRDPG